MINLIPTAGVTFSLSTTKPLQQVGIVTNKVTIMYKATIKNKIPEVYAAARVIVQRNGHTKKFAKHIVVLVIKVQKKLSDEELVEFYGSKSNRQSAWLQKETKSFHFLQSKKQTRSENL